VRYTDIITWYGKTCYWMVTDYRLDKIEYVYVKDLLRLREFVRPMKFELKYDIQENGLRHPIILMYNQPTRTVYVGEGNHRLTVVKSLGIELVPARVVREERTPYKIRGEKIRGIDPNEFGYVKGSLYPSEIGLESYTLAELCI